MLEKIKDTDEHAAPSPICQADHNRLRIERFPILSLGGHDFQRQFHPVSDA